LAWIAFHGTNWPNVRLVHAAFDLMVGAGMILLAVAGAVGWSWWRARGLPTDRWLLRTL
jgi:cytochrome bd ubiquinol oxidase subunit I